MLVLGIELGSLGLCGKHLSSLTYLSERLWSHIVLEETKVIKKNPMFPGPEDISEGTYP